MGDMDQMDEAGPYYNLGPRIIRKTGVFRYMSSRNNAFTNRGQKAMIKVHPQTSGDEP